MHGELYSTCRDVQSSNIHHMASDLHYCFLKRLIKITSLDQQARPTDSYTLLQHLDYTVRYTGPRFLHPSNRHTRDRKCIAAPPSPSVLIVVYHHWGGLTARRRELSTGQKYSHPTLHMSPHILMHTYTHSIFL